MLFSDNPGLGTCQFHPRATQLSPVSILHSRNLQIMLILLKLRQGGEKMGWQSVATFDCNYKLQSPFYWCTFVRGLAWKGTYFVTYTGQICRLTVKSVNNERPSVKGAGVISWKSQFFAAISINSLIQGVISYFIDRRSRFRCSIEQVLSNRNQATTRTRSPRRIDKCKVRISNKHTVKLRLLALFHSWRRWICSIDSYLVVSGVIVCIPRI